MNAAGVWADWQRVKQRSEKREREDTLKGIWTALHTCPISARLRSPQPLLNTQKVMLRAGGPAPGPEKASENVQIQMTSREYYSLPASSSSAHALCGGSKKVCGGAGRWGHTGVHLCSCQRSDLGNSARPSPPEVGQTCFLPYDVSLRNTNCTDFLCSHKKGKETAGKCFTDGKALGISLKRGPPMQMAHYFNIWIFILLKHLFFSPRFYLAS